MAKGEQHVYEHGLHAGDVLLWPVNEQQVKKLFTVVGATHAETALLRLVNDVNAIPPQLSSMYEIRYRLKWRIGNAPTILFADLSKLIVKKSEDIINAINKHADTIAGALSALDLETMLQRLQEEKTISREMKNKFLP